MENNQSENTLEFIKSHKHENSSAVALLLSKRNDLPKVFILNQINGWQKAIKKLPFLADYPNFIFPDPRAVSQSSSEATAKYKANLIKGKTLIDGSGGMGIDSYFFSKKVDSLDYVEQNESLFACSKNNFSVLGANNINCHQANFNDFIESFNGKVDCIYLDPDRRKNASRFFKIEDCEPNILALLPGLWKKTDQVLVKLSPMLDISKALEQLPNCKTVYVVAAENECKELLFLLEKNCIDETQLIAINLDSKQSTEFKFKQSEEQACEISFHDPLNYLYEPNAAILKSGAFKSIAKAFGLQKIAPNTHLYTSEKLVANFPGRTLKIESINKPQKNLLKKANVVSRNFPLKPEEIKKKYKFADGGSLFLYAFSLLNEEKIFVVGEKL